VAAGLASLIAAPFLPGGKICRPGHAPKWGSDWLPRANTAYIKERRPIRPGMAEW